MKLYLSILFALILVLSVTQTAQAANTYVNINASADINDTTIALWAGATSYLKNWGAHSTTFTFGLGNLSTTNLAVILLYGNFSKYIPSNAEIVSANVTLTQISSCGGSAGSVRTIAVNRMLVGWTEGTGDADAGVVGNASFAYNTSTSSWINGNFSTADYDIANTMGSTSITCGTAASYTWNLTNTTIQGMINGTYTNYGVVFRMTTALAGADAGAFDMKELGTYPQVPHFEILYNIPVPPELNITITSPTNSTYFNIHQILNVAANGTVSTWWYKLNTGANITFIPNSTFVAPIGSNKLTVYANDTSGNIVSNTVYFTVDPSTDVTPPTVNITSPVNTTYYTNNISLNVAYSEPINATWYSLEVQNPSSFSKYRIITPTSDVSQTDYQLFVNVTYDSDMQIDFSDVRFYSSLTNESSYLPYCLGSGCGTDWTNNKSAEIVNGSYATGFVRVPVINGVTPIYEKYGNSTLAYGGNPESVFPFFDDFNGASINASKYISISGTFSQSGGILTGVGTEVWTRLISGHNGTEGLLLETMIQTGSTTDAESFALGYANLTPIVADEGLDFVSINLCPTECDSSHWNSTLAFASWYLPETQFINNSIWQTNKDYSVSILVNSTAGFTSYGQVNNTRKYVYHNVDNISQMGISLEVYRGTWKWYFVRERKFHEPQPTYSTGSELSLSSPVVNQTFSPNITITAANGSNHLIVWANDSSQNYGFSEVYFTLVPALHPVGIYLSSPADNANYSTPNQPTFSFFIIDAVDASVSCTLYLNGTAVRTNSTVLNNTVTSMTSNVTLTGGLDHNDYTWYVNCSDSTPMTNQSETRHLTEYVHKPELYILAPNDNSNYVSPNQPTFTFGILDAVDNFTSCTLYINGTPAKTNTTVFNNTITSLTSNFTLTGGTGHNDYYWYINCTDATPTTNQSITRHLTEYTFPTVHVTDPNRVYSTYLIPLNITTNQPTANFTYIATNINTSISTGNVSFSPNATINLSVLGNGHIDLIVYESLYGTIVSETVSHLVFGIDTTNPLIFLTYPTNNSIIVGTNITIYGTAENLNLSSVTVNDTSWGFNLGTLTSWKFNNANLSYGHHSLLFKVNDSIGHDTFMQLEFTNQATPPSPPITGAIPLVADSLMATILAAGGLISMLAMAFTERMSIKTVVVSMVFLIIVVVLAAQFMLM
jgi:hypothetical protein